MKLSVLKDHGFRTDHRTYVVAEVGINHGGDVAVAERLLDSAARAGVDAVKFQTYITEKRAPEGNTEIFEILKRCELPLDAFRDLKDQADSLGVQFFSTAFDEESVEYLESIDVELYKVASFDVVNSSLLRAVASTRKPVILSTGMADRNEIDAAYSLLHDETDSIALLHCVSSYPLAEEDAHLAAIYELQGAYDCIIGYSDHTPGIHVPLLAVAAGAQVIEKHYRIDEGMECVDAPVSITEAQTRELVDEVRRYEAIFGSGQVGVREAERDTMIFRRATA